MDVFLNKLKKHSDQKEYRIKLTNLDINFDPYPNHYQYLDRMLLSFGLSKFDCYLIDQIFESINQCMDHAIKTLQTSGLSKVEFTVFIIGPDGDDIIIRHVFIDENNKWRWVCKKKKHDSIDEHLVFYHNYSDMYYLVSKLIGDGIVFSKKNDEMVEYIIDRFINRSS